MTAADQLPAPRLLFVHAHPDDETITTGLTMAHYAAAGCDVHVLTCTLGEEGEVIPAPLAHLAADRDDTLGAHRREELREAMRRLGVTHHVLGEDRGRGVPSRYRDSGMAGMPSAADPRAFVNADPSEAAGLVAQHLRVVRPDVVVTYDEHGGYAHPDHIRTHEVTMAALRQLDHDPLPAAYVVLTPLPWAVQDREWLAEHVDGDAAPALTVPGPDDAFPPSVVPDEVVTHGVVRPDLVAGRRRPWRRTARRCGSSTATTPCPTTSPPGWPAVRASPPSTRAPDDRRAPVPRAPAGGSRSHDSHDGLDGRVAPVRRGLLGEAGPWA